MQSVALELNDASSIFHEVPKIFKSAPFKFFGKCSESFRFDVNNDLQEDLKNLKSDTFEKCKRFVSAEFHNQKLHLIQYYIISYSIATIQYFINYLLLH